MRKMNFKKEVIFFDAYFDRQLPDDWDDMTEGQLADYMAGFLIMVGKATKNFYVDTETTYKYDGLPISLTDLETLSEGNLFDMNKVTCGRLLFGMIGDEGEDVSYLNEDEFQDWLGTLEGKNDIFIHNLKFDIKFIGRLLHNLGHDQGKKLGKGGTLISAKFQKDGVTIDFKDTMKLTCKVKLGLS